MYGEPLTQASIRPAESFPHPLEDPDYIFRFKDGTPENETEEEKAKFMKQWHAFNSVTQADIRPAEKFPHPLEDPDHIFKHQDDTAANTHGSDREENENMEDEDKNVDASVREDMQRLESTFKGISKRYRLINRIGEGTFSTVYKAEDMLYDHYQNDWNTDDDLDENNWEVPPTKKRRLGDNPKESTPSNGGKKKPRYVALKKIYVTSSPLRIQNELELLHDLRGSKSVCPLITAFRHQDQVIAVLPYFRHTDFRIQYRTFLVRDMRHYFRSLFTALAFVHKHFILHRDIKPTNFLYDPERRRGVLVDFGLAERQGSDYAGPCFCTNTPSVRRNMLHRSFHTTQSMNQPNGYPKNDTRPARRANRAGTRGFRAPEVLFKCTSQTTKIDMWSTGVILLTLLGRRFPFFNSADDVDALVEMASIFGNRRMKHAASMHGQIFETNIPTIGEKGHSWEKLVIWSSCVEDLTESEKQAIRLLSGLLELDPSKRLSAKEALQHEFFENPIDHDIEWGGEPDSLDEGGDSTGEDGPQEGGKDEVDML